MARITVRYQYATYSGERTVLAEDVEHAIAIVKAACRREAGLPMAYEHYRVIRIEEPRERSAP